MRLIKAFLTGITGLFIFITLFSLLIPSKVRVARVILINNTSAGEVYEQIANFNNWKKWHPIFTVDSARLNCERSANVGQDSLCHIIQRRHDIIISLLSADSTSIKFLLQADGENAIDNDIVISTFPTYQSIQVEWRAITKLRWYPWEKFYGIFIDKLTGPGYENALNGLKDFIERIPQPPLVSAQNK